MGTQQLLLIVLGVIIVGIAIAVGITLFKSTASSSNREQVIGDLEDLGSKAQQYYRKPLSFGGGGSDFNGFRLMPVDTGNGNGSFSVSSTNPGSSGPGYVSGDTNSIWGPSQLMYIVGSGKEVGNDLVDPVKAYIRITPDTLTIKILN